VPLAENNPNTCEKILEYLDNFQMEKQPHPLLILPSNFWLIPTKHDTNIMQMPHPSTIPTRWLNNQQLA
jgi:hypothetical protein